MHANGHILWVLVNATLVRDADGNGSYILGQIQDITDRMVDHDPLTGLFNRRRFEQELQPPLQRYGAEALGLSTTLSASTTRSSSKTLILRLLKAHNLPSMWFAGWGAD